MPSADGVINSSKSGNFVATFTIEGDSFSFRGTFDSRAPTFACSSATLNYANLDCVTTTKSIGFGGYVGPSDMEFNLQNRPTINGVLDTSSSHEQDVSGSGVWTLN